MRRLFRLMRERKKCFLLKDVEDKEFITELFAAIYGELPEPAKKKKKK